MAPLLRAVTPCDRQTLLCLPRRTRAAARPSAARPACKFHLIDTPADSQWHGTRRVIGRRAFDARADASENVDQSSLRMQREGGTEWGTVEAGACAAPWPRGALQRRGTAGSGGGGRDAGTRLRSGALHRASEVGVAPRAAAAWRAAGGPRGQPGAPLVFLIFLGSSTFSTSAQERKLVIK